MMANRIAGAHLYLVKITISVRRYAITWPTCCVGLAVFAGSLLPISAQTTIPLVSSSANSAVAGSSASTNAIVVPPSVSAPTSHPLSVETEALLKYQEFLRQETDQNSARLNELVQHSKDLLTALGWGLGFVGGLIVVIAGVAAWFLNYFGRSSYRELAESIKARFDAEADRRLQQIESESKRRVEQMVKEFRETSRASFDARLAQIEETYRRRQSKYLKLLRSYFAKLFETNPELRKQWLGPKFSGDRFRSKRILWVDDDGVGIALFVELLVEHCGLKITIRESTDEVLAESLANYDLVISNLKRDPDDNAGVLMTLAIRQQKQSSIPIIIFTRDCHKRYYQEAIEKAGATDIATSEKELLTCIAQVLEPNPEPENKI